MYKEDTQTYSGRSKAAGRKVNTEKLEAAIAKADALKDKEADYTAESWKTMQTAEQLVRAGVKRLVLIDPDTVDVTNLQRQSLFTEADANQQRLKVEAAKEHLHEINSACQITAIPAPITADLIDEYQFTLCLDCLDNYQARDLLNKLAIIKNFDYLFASCAGTYGNVMAISPQNHPCLNCLFPNINELKQNDCDLIGVNTALIPIVAGLQVSLALHCRQ